MCVSGTVSSPAGTYTFVGKKHTLKRISLRPCKHRQFFSPCSLMKPPNGCSGSQNRAIQRGPLTLRCVGSVASQEYPKSVRYLGWFFNITNVATWKIQHFLRLHVSSIAILVYESIAMETSHNSFQIPNARVGGFSTATFIFRGQRAVTRLELLQDNIYLVYQWCKGCTHIDIDATFWSGI